MRREQGQHRLRTGRCSQRGQVYIITVVTRYRARLFEHASAAVLVLDCFRWLDKEGRIGLEACVVMPDHVHAVLDLRCAALSSVMRSFKGYSGYRLSNLMRRCGPFWQNGYHDHALRSDESLRHAIRYCLANPVRAGLVGDFHDYPFWICRYDI